MTEAESSIGLVDAQGCLELLFSDERSRPKLRWFLEQKRVGNIPYRKIGHFVFYDPAEVRRAIDRIRQTKLSITHK
jgi:hypothetical protein